MWLFASGSLDFLVDPRWEVFFPNGTHKKGEHQGAGLGVLRLISRRLFRASAEAAEAAGVVDQGGESKPLL